VPIVQAALAAGLSWLVAVHVVDHRAPFFAPVAAILEATLCLPGATSGVNRLVDGLIGGATGLLIVGLFPRSLSASAVLVTGTGNRGVSS